MSVSVVDATVITRCVVEGGSCGEWSSNILVPYGVFMIFLVDGGPSCNGAVS